MNDNPSPGPPAEPSASRATPLHKAYSHVYAIAFRQGGPHGKAASLLAELRPGQTVLVRIEERLEPALIQGHWYSRAPKDEQGRPRYEIERLAHEEEVAQYALLPSQEQEALQFCQAQVEHLALVMRLIRVEQFFNGAKIIFYFTAENRVDFRALVKILVQRFRTRVEMRQIGVRHETQMLGGLGGCGRELCCASFLTQFDSVSIKMAKMQDLPLNPAKISGVCNRLLCCLNFEYESYRVIKKSMPRVGRLLVLHTVTYQVLRQFPLTGTILAQDPHGQQRVLAEKEWRQAEIESKAIAMPPRASDDALNIPSPMPLFNQQRDSERREIEGQGAAPPAGDKEPSKE